MNYTNLTSPMIENQSVFTDKERARRTPPVVGLPTLKSVLAEIGSLPHEALFLGLAEDGLPVLLNLYDPIPGPILVTADQSSGKTSLLQMIVRATEYTRSPAEVQFGVVTTDVDEWIQFQKSRIQAGIYDVHDDTTGELLKSLVTWAHNNKGDQQSILLFIDGLEEAIKLNDESEQNLRWLLLRGPSRRVWPFISLDASHAAELKDWMGFFRTRLFGRIQETRVAASVTGKPDLPLADLAAGSQFCMHEGDHWLKFWIPPLD